MKSVQAESYASCVFSGNNSATTASCAWRFSVVTLSARIERHANRRVPQQFLHGLQLRASGPQQRRIGVTKGMPADSFRDYQPSCNWHDMALHDLLRQVRPATLIHWTREHPILWRFISRLAPPCTQRLDQIIVCRDGFLGAFCLTDANDVLHDGAGYVDLLGLEVYVLPFQGEELAPSQSGSHGQQHQDSPSEAQTRKQSLELIPGQNIRCYTALRALSHPLNGVTVTEFVATTVIEQ
jgi:hypothetical protein